MLGCIPSNGKVLIVINGKYGERQEIIAKYLNLQYSTLVFKEDEVIDSRRVVQCLENDSSITHVSFVHHETSVGILNPLEEITKDIKGRNKDIRVLVDSMSGFGAYEVDMKWGIDYLVSSSNKNLEGVPGFAYCIMNKSILDVEGKNARSLVLNLLDQVDNMNKTGQFRFTPPTHVLAAFKHALDVFLKEGGVEGRHAR